MIVLTGTDWDALGRLVMAVGLAAMLAYLMPATMGLSQAWARRSRIFAGALLTTAMMLALFATVAWFLG